jgi:peptidyl-prolyl cis-trans isomerase SurA
MRSCRFLASILLSALCLTAAGQIQAQEVSRVMAIVDDQVITTLDVEKMLRTLEQQMGASIRPGEQAPTPAQLRRLAVDRLVEDKIFELQVKRDKITVSNEELEHFVTRVRTSNNLSEAEFMAQLSRRGLTMDEYREELKKDIIKHKLLERNVKSRVVISDDQVEKTYRALYGGGDATDASMVRFRGIFLQVADDATPAVEQAVKQRAEDLRKQALGGASFAELARKHSQGPAADQGGEIGPMSTTDMIPAMRQAMLDLKPGGVSNVVRVPSGYVFMQLVERGGTSTPAPTAQIKEQIKSKLENEALEKRFQEWIKELRSKIYVKIME